MKPRGDEAIVAAILAEIDVVNAVLVRLHVPTSVHDDLRQLVTIDVWNAARHDRVAWRDPRTLRALLRTIATWSAYAWFRDTPRHVELRGDEATVPSAEGAVIARSVLRYLRENMPSERWKALRSYASGVPVSVIAARAHVGTPTVYNWLRLARADIAQALAGGLR
jgi:DNA-directed RNA polymerase specialized sigma24 family protein